MSMIPGEGPTHPWNYHMRREMQEILHNVYLGPYASAMNSKLQHLKEVGITHIVCIREPKEAPFIRCNFEAHFTYLVVEVRDLPGENIIQHFPRFHDFIEYALLQGGKVLVHGNAGISRSAALLIAYVMETKNVDYENAFLLVQSRRFCINLNEGFSTQLLEYEPIYRARHMVLSSGDGSQVNRMKRCLELDEEDVDGPRAHNPFPNRSAHDDGDTGYEYENTSFVEMET